jgi:uncharacterized protein YqeY
MLKEKIANDLLEARKKANRQKSSLLRTVLGEIERLPSKDHSDEAVTKVLTKFHKNLSEVRQHGNEMAVIEAEYEMAVIEAYLPKTLSEEEMTTFYSTGTFANIQEWMAGIKEYAGEKNAAVNGALAAAVFKALNA